MNIYWIYTCIVKLIFNVALFDYLFCILHSLQVMLTILYISTSYNSFDRVSIFMIVCHCVYFFVILLKLQIQQEQILQRHFPTSKKIVHKDENKSINTVIVTTWCKGAELGCRDGNHLSMTGTWEVTRSTKSVLPDLWIHADRWTRFYTEI